MSHRCPYPGCEAHHGDGAVACAVHSSLLSQPLRHRVAFHALRRKRDATAMHLLREAALMELVAIRHRLRHQEIMRSLPEVES